MSSENPRYMQYIATITASLMSMTSAAYISWPSPALPLLTSGDTPIGVPITDEEGSWIVSILMLVSVPFNFTGGWMAEKIGRKMALIYASILMGIPWIIIIFAKSALVICIARSIAGIGVPLVPISCAMYIGEIADSDIRGKLNSIFVFMMGLGSVIVLGIGPFISYVALAILCMIFPVIFILVSHFLPESPYYLVKVKKYKEAEEALIKLTPKTNDTLIIEKKLEEIKMIIENDSRTESNEKSTIWELFTNRIYRKSIFTVLGVQIFALFSGQMGIQAYMQTIIEASDSSISPEASSVIFGLVSLPAVFLSGLLVDSLGRKPFYIVSALGAAISLIAEGIYFYRQDYLNVDTSNISWIPTTALVGFLFMSSLGLNILPLILLGEYFTTNVKGFATSLTYFSVGLTGFLLTKFFMPVSTEIGIYSTFWIFAGFCVLGAIFVYFVVSETKGKTLAEIQNQLRRNMDANPTKA